MIGKAHKKRLYMAVTPDDMQLPLFVGTVHELAAIYHVTDNNVYTSISHGNSGTASGRLFVKTDEFDIEEETPISAYEERNIRSKTMSKKKSQFDKDVDQALREGKTYAEIQKAKTIAQHGHVNIADIMREIEEYNNKKESDDE